jgi:hypothetical protein
MPAMVALRALSDWRSYRGRGPPNRPHLEMEPVVLLQVAEHGEQVARLRIAARPEHTHQTLGRRAGARPSSSKPIVALM